MDSGTRRNILTYYLNFVVVALVGFILNPLLLTALGPLMFGVWKSLQRYLDFASVADGRASQALKWIVASRAALSEVERRRDVGAAIIVWVRWLPAAALVAAGVTFAIPFLIKGIPEDARSLAYSTAAILAANTVLLGLLSVPDSVLVGVNQGYKTMLINTLAFVASNGAMIIAAFSGWPLWSLAVIVLTGSIGNAAVTLLVTRRAVSWWGVSRPTRTDLRRVMGYSAWTLGWAVVERLFLASELIVISVMLGAVAVTQYTFTSYVTQFVLSIAVVSASAFMPLLGSQLGASDSAAAAERATAVRHLVVGLTVLGSGAVLAFNAAFVALWVGTDQYLGTLINMLLVVCGLQQALIRMDGQILDVTMRIAPKVVIGGISTAGGIAAGCVGFALTQSLAVGLVAIIVLRLISNVAYPVLVARSIAGSAVPLRAIVIGAAFLAVSFLAGPVTQDGEPLEKVAVIAGWLVMALGAAWLGLVPRNTVRAMITGGGTR